MTYDKTSVTLVSISFKEHFIYEPFSGSFTWPLEGTGITIKLLRLICGKHGVSFSVAASSSSTLLRPKMVSHLSTTFIRHDLTEDVKAMLM
jgi:hypothetical protein